MGVFVAARVDVLVAVGTSGVKGMPMSFLQAVMVALTLMNIKNRQLKYFRVINSKRLTNMKRRQMTVKEYHSISNPQAVRTGPFKGKTSAVGFCVAFRQKPPSVLFKNFDLLPNKVIKLLGYALGFSFRPDLCFRTAADVFLMRDPEYRGARLLKNPLKTIQDRGFDGHEISIAVH